MRSLLKGIISLVLIAGMALLLGVAVIALFAPVTTGLLRPIPFWWGWFDALPLVDVGTPSTIYPFIYLPQDIYNDALSQDPTGETRAILVHEEAHIKQQSARNTLRYATSYVLSRTFRFEEELEAIGAEMAYRKQFDLSYDIERKAHELSGSDYLWAASFDTARTRLEVLWESS